MMVYTDGSTGGDWSNGNDGWRPYYVMIGRLRILDGDVCEDVDMKEWYIYDDMVLVMVLLV